MPKLVLSAFVSATTRDLSSYRKTVADVLRTCHIQAVVQEHLGADTRTIREMLRQAIEPCDAVICLVGFVFGQTPSDQPTRSYTQLEFDIARELQKPIYRFVASQQCRLDEAVQQTPEQERLQQLHRQAIMQDDHRWDKFDTHEELRELAYQASLKTLRDSEASGQPSGSGVAVRRLEMRYLHPPKPPTYFVGRTEELAQLQQLMSDRRPAVIAVIGMGGQGKTTLISQALRDQQHFPFAAGFWCTAYRGGFTFDMFLDEVLNYLLEGKFDKREVPEIGARVRRLVGLLQERATLLVIDGLERWLQGWNLGAQDRQVAETVEERIGFFEGLDDFLEQAAGLNNGTHVILTSRALPAVLDDAERAVVPVRDPEDRDLSLEGLDLESSVALLTSLGVKGEPGELQRVAQSYAQHPLALTVLAGLLTRKYGGRLTRLPTVTPMDPRRSLFKLFEEARRNLPGRTAAEQFLKVASHCLENASLVAISDVLQGAAQGQKPSIDELLDQAVVLADWHLLDWDGEAETVRLHPLVKQYFAAQAGESESAAIHERFSNWYASQPILDGAATLEHVGTRVLAIEHAARAGDTARCAELLFDPLTPMYSFVGWLAAFGHFATGADLLRTAIEMSAGKTRAKLLIARAVLCRHLSNFPQTISDLGEAVSILDGSQQELSGEELANLAGALWNRGNAFRQLASYDESFADFDRAVGILQQLSAKDGAARFQLAQVLVNRATVLRETGQLRRAIRDCTAAIELYESHAEPMARAINPELALALLNRGNAFGDLTEDESALQDYTAAMDIYSALVILGQREFRPRAAHVRIARGTVLHNLERFREAATDFDEAIRALRELVDQGRQDLEGILALGHMTRAMTSCRLGQFRDALQDNQVAESTFRRLLERGHPEVEGLWAHAMLNGSMIRHESGDKAGAQDLRSRGFEVARRVCQQGAKMFLIVFVRYAVLHAIALLAEDPEQGLALLDEALGKSEEAIGSPEPSEGLEGLEVELMRGLSRLEAVEFQLGSCGFDLARLDRLRRLLESSSSSSTINREASPP